MTLLFTIAAGLTSLLGVAWLFFPRAMLSAWRVPPDDPVTVYMSRRYGGLFFGYAVILWMARAAEASPSRTAILAGSALVCAVMAVVSLAGARRRVVGPAVWGAVVVEVLLAAGFTYYLLTTP